ncbi:MAG: spore protein [Clostridiales bacterium]
MKKRDDDWNLLKTEIAKELGLWDKVAAEGWSGLSAEESGRLGGIFARRRRSLTASINQTEQQQAEGSSHEPL